jgi:protein SCO1/2
MNATTFRRVRSAALASLLSFALAASADPDHGAAPAASGEAEAAAPCHEEEPPQAHVGADGKPVVTIPGGAWSDEPREVMVGDVKVFLELENDGDEPPLYEPKLTVEEIATLNTRVEPFSLVDQNGESFGAEQLKGRVWVLSFIFTRCSGPCPVLSAQGMRLRQSLGEAADKIDFVTISVDPDFDTPEVLARYAERFDAPTGNWRLLTGDYAKILHLANNVFRAGLYKHGGKHDAEAGLVLVDEIPEVILHSRRFILVDADGFVRGYYEGVQPSDVDRLLRDLRAMVADAE